MPSKSRAQQGLMGSALACKRGKGACTGGAAKVAATMPAAKIREFAATKTKGLPAHVKKAKK